MLNNFPHVSVKKTGRNIQRLMLEKNLSVSDIQDAMGFEYPQAIYKWFRGNCLPTVENLIRLAILFETTIEKIVIIED